ncbi:class I SAM-dependent methyltransferase [Sporosarcina sp. P7]|uniref:class I SAM-dependent methyltransferase n=1 Tax=Sporosarcina sp. P7 TaxID=2048244 RepID=UPI000C1698CE|nr:class I SAM-dependent methyltransferase [Sporosarcina sp. P7]PID23311.1 methyltransferase [Sporosarcina sp. P7]
MSKDNEAKCYLCGSQQLFVRHDKVRDSDEIKVMECSKCNLVFLSSFNHIEDGFYEESGMLYGRVNLKTYRNNSFKDDERRADYFKEKFANKSVLDFGCGAGGFLHLIRNQTETAEGLEIDRQLNNILNEEDIRCYATVDQIKEKYDFVSLFHVLEHMKDPIKILKDLKALLNNKGKIIIEVPNSEDALLTIYKNQAFADFTYWGCHLFLFNYSTLSEVCKRAGYEVKYVKQIQRYPLSNHLYWLAAGKPGGHKELTQLVNSKMNGEYEAQLASLGACDTLLAEISLIENPV